MQVILDSKAIAVLLEKLADEIIKAAPPQTPLALIGIRSRGEIIAQRLQKIIQSRLNQPVDQGTLDITLYRDDLNQPRHHQPNVRPTEIDFDIDDRLIVLVDDVLNTGRSARAALDALIDYGRPLAIRLAVLVDRGQRELPISADYIGKVVEAPKNQRVNVYLNEVDNREEVVLE